jgi:hypothetical protein
MNTLLQMNSLIQDTENSPYVSYDETLDQVQRNIVPFLQDRDVHEYMILQNSEFFIASKCYSWRMRIRRNTSIAHLYIDPAFWVIDPSRSFYDLMVHIKAVVEFLRGSSKEMMDCKKDWQKNLSGPFFWMSSVYDAIEANRKMFDGLIRQWAHKEQLIIAEFERKRIMEFAMLLNQKFYRKHGAKVQGITFKILRGIFTFHPLNRSKIFFPTLKRKAPCELFE